MGTHVRLGSETGCSIMAATGHGRQLSVIAVHTIETLYGLTMLDAIEDETSGGNKLKPTILANT